MSDQSLVIKLLRRVYPQKQPSLIVKVIKLLWSFLFQLARLTHVPKIGKVIGDLLYSEDDTLFYLPKREVISLHESIQTPDNIVLPSKIVEYFIKKTNTYFIMDFCICRKANQCENYPIDLGCLFLGPTAKKIPREFGQLVTEEEAVSHLRRCEEAGLIHLIGRHRVDSVWLNAVPEHKLLTICNCCPCCCLHRTLPKLDPSLSEKVKKMPGVDVSVTEDCIGCGSCVDICFVDAIQIEEGQAVIGDTCRGCGRCVDVCPEDAIRLSIDQSDFLERVVEDIEAVVDVT